jgi:CubicO group peptidase (beta-lactamase class C family)
MSTRIMPLLVALATIAAAALLSACGGSAKSSLTRTPTKTHPRSTTTNPSAPTSLPLEYAECMRAHRVRKFPDPVNGHVTLSPASGINPDSPTFKAAAKACAKYGPSGASAGGSSTAGATTATAASPETWRDFAAWLKAQAAGGRFSGSVLVAKRDQTVLDAGYGLADRATRAPNVTATLFCIASIGKLFTAVAIGQLAERHQLSFDAPVGDYLTGLPAAIGDHVTIGDLLDMTAGLGNAVLRRANPPRALDRMVSLIANERLQFQPGARFFYSNDDYILLGAVVQKLSGESYADYLRQHILTPADMTHTGYSTYIPGRVFGMAHGYALSGSTLHDISDEPQIANPSGGAYSTTGDLLRFARAVLDHKLLTPAMTATILTPRVESPQPGGPPVDKYTYGFAYQQVNGITFVGHNGGTPGYAGQIDIYPDAGCVVVILTNRDDALVPAIQRSEAILTNSPHACGADGRR